MNYFDQNLVKKFQQMVQYNATEEEINIVYSEIHKRGLKDNPDIKACLQKYKRTLLKKSYKFIVQKVNEAKKLGSDYPEKPADNNAMNLALYEYFDLGGMPDEKIVEAAEFFNVDIESVATNIVRHKQEVILYDDIVDVICGSCGLTYLIEQAMGEVKKTMLLYNDWEQRKQFSTTLYIPARSSNEENAIYSIECGFDDNGNCQTLSIRIEGSDYPLTVDVSKVKYLSFSKNNLKEQSVDNEAR